MLRRIGFLGLTLTVLLFALMGAALGWYFVPDFTGHGMRQRAFLAGGAAILGATGWFYSERFAATAELNAHPFLRLALSGAIACWLATLAASTFAEFTVGTGSLVEFAIPVVYALTGLLPLIGGIGLIGSMQSILAALRGDGQWRGALVLVRHHVTACFALALISAYAASFHGEGVRAWLTHFAPDTARKSAWTEHEKKLFSEIHRGVACDLVLPPFEANKDSTDRPARSLMARQLAETLARGGLCVADVTLVARALGSGARKYADREVEALGAGLNARWIVRGEVALSGPSSFEVTLRAWERQGKEWGAAKSIKITQIAFSDANPPEVGFAAQLPGIVEQLALPDGSTSESQAAPEALTAQGTTLPASVFALVGGTSTLSRARALQLVALSYPDYDWLGEQLWERSLMAAAALPANDVTAQVLKARAALHLNRRPYALALLKDTEAAEARNLMALLQGHLPHAEESLSSITDPTAALISQIETAALRATYGQPAVAQAKVPQNELSYQILFGRHLLAGGWQPVVHEQILGVLKGVGMQTSEGPVAQTLHRFADWIQLGPHADALSTALAIERSYGQTWRGRGGAQWILQPASDRLAEWDIYDAFYASNRAALHDALREIGKRESASEVIALMRHLGSSLAGYPPIHSLFAEYLAERSRTVKDPLLKARLDRTLKALAAWEGGETPIMRTLSALSAGAEPFRDEPARPWRWFGDKSPEGQGQALAICPRAIEYAHDSFAYLEYCHQVLSQAKRGAQAAQLLEQHDQRFVGDPRRAQYLIKRAIASEDPARYAALLRDEIRAHPSEWKNYLALAGVQLGQRDTAAAFSTLFGYPAFRSHSASGAEVSQRAHDAGALFWHVGETAPAIQFFKLAVAYKSASAAELSSLRLIAAHENRWTEARKVAQSEYDRSKSFGALVTESTYAFLVGEPDIGWRHLKEALQSAQDDSGWDSAVLANRITAATDDALLSFAKSVQANPAREQILKERFLFQVSLIDRPAREGGLQLIASAPRQEDDYTYRLLGAGYHAFKRGDYSAMLANLRKLDHGGPSKLKGTTLPYVVLGLAKTGKQEEAMAELETYRLRSGRDFFYLLAKGYAHGLRGDFDSASSALWSAFTERPGDGGQDIPPSYQLLEAYEKLRELTGDARYVPSLLDVAKRLQSYWPYSWAYAMEAKCTAEPEARDRALVVAMYLDRHSEHLAGIPGNDLFKAKRWLSENNPYRAGAAKHVAMK